MNILTYTSDDAPEKHRWLARFQVGKGFTTAFATAPTREAVIAKAQAQQLKEEATIQAILENRWDLSFVDALEARCNN